MDNLSPRLKIWLEKDGLLVFSEFRARLLRLIEETGSLAEAAEQMGLSYRRAWGKLREIESNLGESLVHSARGGSHGGRSELTPLGQRLLSEFDELTRRARETTGAGPDDQPTNERGRS